MLRRVPRRPSAEGACAAFEFRHPSWLDDEVFERLRGAQPRAVRRRQREAVTPVGITADYAYFRLRDEGYTPDDIARWADTIARETASLPRRVRLLQARGRGEGPRVRTAADDAGWESATTIMTDPFLDREDAFGRAGRIPAGARQPSWSHYRRNRHWKNCVAAGARRQLLADRRSRVRGRCQRRSVRRRGSQERCRRSSQSG